jgi:alpha-galactosidase
MVLVVASSLSLAGAGSTLALDNGLARTPPMGWNSWNRFGCNINDSLIRSIADAMVSSGMQAAGYQYVNLDDCWQVSRDSAGNIVADASRFPSGIKALADYVHSKGLKLGVYTDAGTATCAGRPGTLNHEQQDAKTYAAWGVDYVKEDWCNTAGLDPATQYAKFRDALASSGRPILFSICNWGVNSPWSWGPATGNMWRTTGDINDSWSSMTSIIDQSGSHASAARPGAWNDPDMLEVGNGGMNATEYRSHMSMWAIMAAPLIAGNDIRSMSAETHDILTAPEVLAVDQDPAGVQGVKVSDNGAGLQVWAKRLQQTGAVAVALFNRSGASANMTASWSAIGLAAGSGTVRDLWARADRGSYTSSYTVNVPSHGTALLKIVGTSGGPTSPVGPIVGLASKCVDVFNNQTANGTKVELWSCNGGANQQWTVGSDGTVRSLGKCLDINGGTSNNTLIALWDCNGGANQQWQAYNGGLRNPQSGRCLDVPNNNSTNGTQLIIWDCNGGANQRWTLP